MQKISATIVSSVPDSGYSRTNQCVGLIKDMILSATNAALISDNNPNESTKRIVDIQIGNSQHYIRLYTTSGSVYYLSVRNIANSGDLLTTSEMLGTSNLSTNSSYNFTLMYSDTGFFFGFDWGRCIGFAKMTDESWTAFYEGTYCYLYNIDTKYTIASTNYAAHAREDGKEYIIPAKILTNASVYYNADFCSCLYRWDNVKSLSSDQLLDNAGTLWQRAGSKLLLR